MAVHVDFYKNKNFGGSVDPFTRSNTSRYLWIVFGSSFGDAISSFRANAYGGKNGNVFAFMGNHFLGDYMSLNMKDGGTSWWNVIGSAHNDDISSAILVNREKSEFATGLKEQMAGDFSTALDAKLKGTQVSRSGAPRIFSNFWPGHDPNKTFVSIEQDLHVTLDWWPDYDAQVRYDIYLYLNGSGKVQGYVAWTYVWVEGGIFSGDIFDSLQPKLVAGASELTTKLQQKLAIFQGFTFSTLYLLPGPPPSNAFGDVRNAKDDATLVLAPKPF
jgi:hypothetical protein